MNFIENKLPSSTEEVKWHWTQCIQEKLDFTEVSVHGKKQNFTLPADYFDMKDSDADKIAFIGRQYVFFSQPVAMEDFELNIFGEINPDTQIGGLLSSIKHLRPTADVYGLFARYKYIEKSVYCAITVCYVDKEFGSEMETAVFEISEDEHAYVLPVGINEEALDYYTLDDLAKLAYWLGNFWLGVQYEIKNCPEEIRVIEKRGPITPALEEEIHQKKRPILIKRIIPIDADGNEVKYESTGSGRKYTLPVWGVRGHPRTLPNGRITFVRPYPKGKNRKNPDALISKEYKFVEDKIDLDTETTESKSGL
ncbi:MAG: hypothetical protein E7384_05835 [Ruminococcaceae bacterium]|nr:hypothetical protein [Oscillospiraceae bacterium]